MEVVGGTDGESAGGDALRVGSEGGKLRHWLAGREVRHWDLLEVQLADKTWLRGRYEWTGRPADDPALIIELAGAGELWRREAQLLLPIGAELRWVDPQNGSAVDGGQSQVVSASEPRAEVGAEPPAPRTARRRPAGGTRPRRVIDVRDEPAEGKPAVSEDAASHRCSDA